MTRNRIVCACMLAVVVNATGGSVRLNEDALAFANRLIERDSIVADRHKDWRTHKPSAADENEFVRAHGFAEYAKWHLGMDDSHAANTKAHYKFPFGDFTRVHRCGLLAVKARAHQFGYTQIETAAEQLLARIPRGEKRVD